MCYIFEFSLNLFDVFVHTFSGHLRTHRANRGQSNVMSIVSAVQLAWQGVTVSKVLSLLSHGRACPRQLRWGWLCPAKSAQPAHKLVDFEASHRNGAADLNCLKCSECPSSSSSSSLCGGGVLGGGLTKCRPWLRQYLVQRLFLKHVG